MSNNKPRLVTGRGGAGNFRAAPLKLDIDSASHPQTAQILAQHEATNLEYEREVMKRHKEAKANTPRVSGRGGIGNITESNPRSPTKPLRRASFFKGGGAGISSLSSPTDMLDMNAFDEDERRKYALERGSRYMGTPGITGTTLGLSPDSEYSGSDQASSCGMSVRTQSSSSSASSGTLAVSESPAPPTSPSKERHIISKLWRKASKSDTRADREDFNRDLLARAEVAASPHYGSHNDTDHRDNFPDFAGDPAHGRQGKVGVAL